MLKEIMLYCSLRQCSFKRVFVYDNLRQEQCFRQCLNQCLKQCQFVQDAVRSRYCLLGQSPRQSSFKYSSDYKVRVAFSMFSFCRARSSTDADEQVTQPHFRRPCQLPVHELCPGYSRVSVLSPIPFYCKVIQRPTVFHWLVVIAVLHSTKGFQRPLPLPRSVSSSLAQRPCCQ